MNKALKKKLKPILLPLYRVIKDWLQKDRRWVRILLSTFSPVYASKYLYKKAFSKKLDLKNPKTLNEKCMWLKLHTYYNHPLITECCDKYRVRDYVKSCECGEILNELIGVWNSPDEIDFDKLPNKFVLKCNHGCGYNIIVNDKSKLDVTKTRLILKEWLCEDYWRLYAETQYKFIKKKIICEKLIETKHNDLPEDYKIYCVNGKFEVLMFCAERSSGNPKFYFFDKNLNYVREYYQNDKDVDKTVLPENINKMIHFAERLAVPFPFVRVDLYSEQNRIYFGELTFLPTGGTESNLYSNTESQIDLSIEL